MKKVLALLLALVLGLSMLSACGGESSTSSAGPSKEETPAPSKDEGKQTDAPSQSQEDETQPADNWLPLTEEKQELTVWFNYSGTVVSDLNQIEGVKKMEELTNVHINWIPIEQQTLSDKLGTVLASGDYPDILYIGSARYPGGIETGIEDGVIRDDMDELIRNNMPHYMNYLNNNDTARKQATADNGKMQIIKVIAGEDFNCKAEGVYNGVVYRKDILEKLGLSEPKSIDEWHNALLKAKESGMESPFVLHTNGGSFLSQAWGVPTISSLSLMMEDGKVTGGVLKDAWADYLDTMRAWYSEGLIDPNFTSFNYYLDTPGSVENDKYLLYSFVLSAFTGNNYYSMHMCNNESEFLQPIVPPPVYAGQKTSMSYSPVEAKDTIFISTNCKNPELAAKWIDFSYSKEGELLNWYGIEDVTYTFDDEGLPQFTDMVLKDPNNMPPSDILQKYALNWGNAWFAKHNTIASEKVATAAAGGTNQQKEAVEIWTSAEENIGLPSGYTLTLEENDAINTKQTAVQTLIEEYMINYIIGEDNTSFEEFKNKVIQYGYQEIIDTYQAAIDRFNNR